MESVSDSDDISNSTNEQDGRFMHGGEYDIGMQKCRRCSCEEGSLNIDDSGHGEDMSNSNKFGKDETLSMID